jgi:hypothetical protein
VANLKTGRGQFLRCERPDAVAPRENVVGIEAAIAAMRP